jgi:GNAT superfamily N-acetyltransferase
MLLATFALAIRIERADALNAVESAEAQRRLRPDSGGEVLAVGTGFAAFAGVGSPISQARGFGMAAEFDVAQIDTVEQFYRDRGCTSVNFDLCPLAHAGLCEGLGRRGYRIVEYNNALARRIGRSDAWPKDERVRQCRPDDIGLWSRTVMGGFFDKSEPSVEEVDLGSMLFGMEGGAAFIATLDGMPAGGAGMSIRSGLAFFFGDSTLPSYRARGLQRTLIEARLSQAVSTGCDLAVSTTLPGTISQRNYERCGFQVLYTKMNMQRDF